jgi:hypothetical protein
MALQLNLEKSKVSLQLCLQKAGVVTPPVMDVGVLMDVSGSFEDEHRDGTTNQLLARLVPWGLAFDPDRKVDVTTFSNGEHNVERVGSVDAGNYEDFVQQRVVDRVRGWNGGTDYSYVLEDALRLYGWLDGGGRQPGFLGRLFGAKAEAAAPRKRSLVLFITDGENNRSDLARTEQVLAASQERKDEVYFLFLGVCNGGSPFHFLKKLGKAFDNTGFVEIDGIRQFVAQPDDALNGALLPQELIDWLKR